MKPIGGNRSLLLKKGAWTSEEDTRLKNYIMKHGEGKWHLVPLKAGLNRCRKSCRLRWLNYLRPNIKRGDFEEDEVDLMLRLHKLLGNRWSLISGRIPGRTANDIKNYWNTHVRSRSKQQKKELKEGEQSQRTMVQVFKPQPRRFSKTISMYPQIEQHDKGSLITPSNNGNNVLNISSRLDSSPVISDDKLNEYFNELFEDYEREINKEIGWSLRGINVEGKDLNVVEKEDGQNSVFNFPTCDSVTWGHM